MTAPHQATIRDLCRSLRLPSVASHAPRLAEEAERRDVAPLAYLAELLELEVCERAERRAARRLKEGAFPIIKTLESFDFLRNPDIPEAQIRRLADGDYIDKAEPVILLGEPGTGKTHIAIALGAAAAHQGRRVRFITAAQLVNELIEARDGRELGRVVRRYSRVDLLILDELGYVPLGKTDAELLFQVLTERHELRSVIITTNLPFGEWTTVFPDPRLCRAALDRLTHRAHIIETGKQSGRIPRAGHSPPRESA